MDNWKQTSLTMDNWKQIADKLSSMDEHPDDIVVQPDSPRKLRGEFGNLDDGSARSLRARSIALRVAPSVVALTSFIKQKILATRSGTIIEWDGLVGTILTAATLLTGRNEDDVASDVTIEVTLPDGNVIPGSVANYDTYHNIATVSIRSHSELKAATIVSDPELLHPGQSVIALGRHWDSRDFMASCGNIDIKRNSLDCEDLLSTSCIISTCGVGGPLIDISSGGVIGMSFKGESTHFLPSSILLRCLEHFKSYGEVNRPWLGLKTRPLYMLNIATLETIHQKFPCIDGLFVRKVIKGSLADLAGLSTGDVVTHCEGVPVHSPVEFAGLLFDKAEKYLELCCDQESDGACKRRASSIEVVLKRKSNGCTETKTMVFDQLSPAKENRWSLNTGITYVGC